MHPVAGLGLYPNWNNYKRDFIKAVDAIRNENNHMLLRRRRYYLYQLDCMIEDKFIWRPYVDSVEDAMLIPPEERYLWTAPYPLFYLTHVEWCYTDRVARQFGLFQPISSTSPVAGHSDFHKHIFRYPMTLEDCVQRWTTWKAHVLGPPVYRETMVPACHDEYRSWYDSVTRRFIVNPKNWSLHTGFQGTQGNLPVAGEGISRAYHAIIPTGAVELDDDIGDAVQTLHSTLDVIGFPLLHARPPPPHMPHVAPEPRGAAQPIGRPHRSYGCLGAPPSPPRVDPGQWPAWPRSPLFDASQGHAFATPSSAEYMSPHAFHTSGSHLSGHVFHAPESGSGSGSGSGGSQFGQYLSPPLQSQIIYDGGSSTFQTPSGPFQAFASHDSPWSIRASTTVVADDVDQVEEEEEHPPPL